MAQRTVTIYNRHYTISCDDGQEDSVDRHARALDERVRALANTIGKLGDSQLLVIAGILMSDELAEADAEIQRLRSENESLAKGKRSGGKPQDSEAEKILKAVDDSLNAATDRIEDLAERLSRA